MTHDTEMDKLAAKLGEGKTSVAGRPPKTGAVRGVGEGCK